jgi:hypothetical protein
MVGEMMQVIKRRRGVRWGRITHCGIASRYRKKDKRKTLHVSPLLALRHPKVPYCPYIPLSGLLPFKGTSNYSAG